MAKKILIKIRMAMQSAVDQTLERFGVGLYAEKYQHKMKSQKKNKRVRERIVMNYES